MSDAPVLTNSPDFRAALAIVLEHEGGFQDDPDDAGNWTGGGRGAGECRGTKWGISAAMYRDEDIANLTEERAAALYWTDYWLPWKFGQLPGPVAAKAFDMGVDMGPQVAIRLLQRAIASCGQICAVDGLIGPHTADAARAIAADQLMTAYRAELADYYRKIVAGNPVDGKYLGGWLARANS